MGNDPSFRKLTVEQRLEVLQKHSSLSAEELEILRGQTLSTEIAEHLIENAIGYFRIPLGIATNFVIDGKERYIPMAVEETSIIAAASATAKWIRTQGE